MSAAMNPSLLTRSLAFLRSRRPLRIALWALGLVAAYALIGFLIVPPAAKYLLEKKLAEALHRPVAIAGVSFNPFTLEAEVRGLSVTGSEGREVFGFGSFYANLEAVSILRGGPVLHELRLAGPRLAVTRLGAGRYDVSDLIDQWSKPSGSPTPHFAINNIQVSDGRITFIDRPKGVTHRVTDLALRLPFISSLPYQADIFVEPHFSARINGAPLVLEGRSKPFAESHESELQLDLDRLDLARYTPYSPLPLPFAVRGGTLDTELKLLFRQSREKPATLQLVGALHLRDLVLDESGGAPLLAWKQLDVTVHEADLLHRRFELDRIRLAGLAGHVRRSREGRLNWQDVADRLAGRPAAGKAEAPAAPLAWSVREIRVEDGRLSYEDQGLPGAAPQMVEHIDASLRNLSSASGQKMAVALAAQINGGGSLKAAGDVRLQPLSADLDLDIGKLSLLPVQPYFGERLNLTLTRGQLSGQGRLSLTAGADGLGGGFKGQLTLGDVQSVDKASGADFLKWKSLFVGDIDARLRPVALSVGQVALSDFYARLMVSPQGRLNLLQVVRRPEAPPPPPAAAKTTAGRQTTAEVAPAPGREPLPVRIGKVTLQGGTVNFSDFFVKPNYTVNVTRISGRVTGLSSASGTVADLELRGSYGNSAPVQVLAKLNPLAARTYLDLKGEIRGVDLTTLSTYSRKYAGYAIDEGKLSLFVTYKLDHDRLTADNRVFLDQLSFGERVDSPQATSLPVKLAVALLKNRRGEIDVNLPISGSIDDPDFSLGGIILRVIGNLVVKTASSPFTFLGSVFGGGEELSHVDFDPGRATLGPDAVHRLEALARAMNDRPALKLEITGRADPGTDREGLKRAALERAVLAEKTKEAAKKGQAGGASGALAPGEYPVYLRRAYKEAKFPKPRNLIGLNKELPAEEMEKLMLANLPVGEEDLRELAELRVDAVQSWLAEQGKVSPERLFPLSPKIGGDKDEAEGAPGRVDFSLR